MEKADIRHYVNEDHVALILKDWEKTTGMTAVVTDAFGEVLAGASEYTDFTKDIVVEDVSFGRITGGPVTLDDADEEKQKKRAGADFLKTVLTAMAADSYNRSRSSENGEIESALKEIDKCIKQIKDIANSLGKMEHNQKILALNASIEAARAGEAGKGFAIVAKKVESLAGDIGKSNTAINAKMRELQELVERLIK